MKYLVFSVSCILFYLSPSSPLANPSASRSFTDDPFVDENKFVETVVRHEIVSVEGEKAEVPCDINDSVQIDRPKLILWYKGKNKLPIYSLDLRGGLKRGHHWKDNSTIGNRGFVYYQESPGKGGGDLVQWFSSLQLSPVLREDSGKYRCRIDFSNTPTHNSWVKLKVIVPPRSPVIENDRGVTLTTKSDPVTEGSSIRLHCITSGNPVPAIIWKFRGIPVHASSSHSDANSGVIKSSVVIKDIEQTELDQVVECIVSNSDLVLPASAAILLDIISPPQRIKIVREFPHFTGGTIYNLTCQVLGSSPAPEISIYKGTKLLHQSSREGNVSGRIHSLVVQYRADRADQGEFLICRARNILIPNLSIEDQWRIDVQYKPEVEVRVEKGSVYTEEGQDLELRCNVNANPPAILIHWFRQDQDLETMMEKNIKIYNDKLTINSILRIQGGNYTCSAGNRISTSVSPPKEIYVKNSPTCSLPTPTTTVLGAMDSSLRLECRMSSKPEHQSFIWTFHNQDGSELQVPNHLVESNGAASTLIHILSSDEDLGTLECALNNMDNQFSQPCRFKIKKKVFSVAGVSSCSCFNQTFTSFSVSCSLPSLQSKPEPSAHTNILFQVFDAQTLKLVRNISSSSSQHTFTDLPASRDFLLQVLVEQDGIISEPFRTDAFTLRANDKQLAASTEKDSSNSARFLSIVGILVGIFSILALFSVALAVFLKKGRRHHQHFFQAKPNNCDSPTPNPDIIPNFNFPVNDCNSIEDLSCKELVHEDWGKHNDQSLVLSGEDWGPPGEDWGQSTYSSFEPSIDTFSSGTQYASLQFNETPGALDTVGPGPDSEKPRSPGSEKFLPPVQYSDINFTALQLATVRCGRNSNLRSSFSINDFPSEDQDSAVRFHSLKPKRKTVKFQDELNNPSKDTKDHICPHLQKSRTLSMSCRAPKDHDIIPLGLQVLQPQVQVQVPPQGYFVTQDLESKL